MPTEASLVRLGASGCLRLGRRCSDTFKVDVGLLISHFGRNYSLYDKRSSCRIYSCDDESFFLASPGGGTPLRPLVTKAHSG